MEKACEIEDPVSRYLHGHLSASRIRLDAGHSESFRIAGEESVVVVQRGAATLRVGATAWKAARRDVFTDRASALYLPPGDTLDIRAEDAAFEAVVFSTPAPEGGQAIFVGPDGVQVMARGRANYSREVHNIFVDEFRKVAQATPDEDSGLRHPDRPTDVIAYRQVSNDDLFEIARLVVAAEIAKIHTIEWTTQLLYDEPLYAGMNANWSGLFKDDVQATRAAKLASDVTARIVSRLGSSKNAKLANQFYSALAAGPGHCLAHSCFLNLKL